jgi:hypothetical protein
MSILFGSVTRHLYPKPLKPPIPPKRPPTATAQTPIAPAKDGLSSTRGGIASAPPVAPSALPPADAASPLSPLSPLSPQLDTLEKPVVASDSSDLDVQESLGSHAVKKPFEMDISTLGTWVAVHDLARYEHQQTAPAPAFGVVGADDKPPKPTIELTHLIPPIGYFFAGALAGGISRTTTAPLDRLKVYLLVKTETNNASGQMASALRALRPMAALKIATAPFHNAIRDIWAAGGIRNFFAGVSSLQLHPFSLPDQLLRFRRQCPQRRQDHARDSHQVWIVRGHQARYRQHGGPR